MPCSFICHEKNPYVGWFGSAWYMFVIDQFHRASNSAFLSSWTAIIIPYDMPSERTSGVLDVGDVGERAVLVRPAREEEKLRLGVAVEELAVRGLDLRVDLLRRAAGLDEEVAVAAGRVRAFAVGGAVVGLRLRSGEGGRGGESDRDEKRRR